MTPPICGGDLIGDEMKCKFKLTSDPLKCTNILCKNYDQWLCNKCCEGYYDHEFIDHVNKCIQPNKQILNIQDAILLAKNYAIV